jgi:hypothetical protein
MRLLTTLVIGAVLGVAILSQNPEMMPLMQDIFAIIRDQV